MLAEITKGLGLPVAPASVVQVEQSASSIDSVVEVADFAAALVGAIGSTVVAHFFQSGWQFDISPVFTPVNGFYRTRDGREIFFNGAYQHLREGILRFLDCPSERDSIAKRVAQHDA